MPSASAADASSAATARRRSAGDAASVAGDASDGGAQQTCLGPSFIASAVALHDEDLPHVAVGILDPNLVLERVAARRVLLGARLQARWP